VTLKSPSVSTLHLKLQDT